MLRSAVRPPFDAKAADHKAGGPRYLLETIREYIHTNPARWETDPERGWRIYEGGGGVKAFFFSSVEGGLHRSGGNVENPRFVRVFQARGKSLVLRLFQGASFPPPGFRSFQLVGPHFSLDACASYSLAILGEPKLTHLSGREDQDVDSQPGAS